MGWPSQKRLGGEYDNGPYKFARHDRGREEDYYPRNSSRRSRSSMSPRLRSPHSPTHNSAHEHRRGSPSSPPARRFPLRSSVPKAVERSGDSASTGLAVGETSAARSRPTGYNVAQAAPRIGDEAREVLLEPSTWEAYEQAGMLSLEQQLPQLRSRDDVFRLDKYSPPRLLPTIEPSVFEWKTAYFAVRHLRILATLQMLKFIVQGILVYIDATAFQRLKALGGGQPCRFLRQSEMTQMQNLVILHAGDHPELVDPKAFDDVHHRELQWPSINTLSREAFNWYIGPRLTLAERQLLDAYWAGLPRFREEMPNTLPGDHEQRATPIQLPDGDWDWTEMLQPIRWFMCPCALNKHMCESTGYHFAQCQGYQSICCSLICRHRPDTTVIHVGTLCKHEWKGNPCPKGRDCKFVHGVAVTAKGIEHRLYHHRIRGL